MELRCGLHFVVTVFALITSLVICSVPARAADPGSTEIVSIASNWYQGNNYSINPVMSAYGRYVAFESVARNLVVNDNNDSRDVFLRDRETNQTQRVSLAADESEANESSFHPSMSTDSNCSWVAFDSLADNLIGAGNDTNGLYDVFVRDRVLGHTTRVSVASGGAQATGSSFDPSISGDGHFVAFQSDAADLVVDDTNGCSDIFVHDRWTNTTERVSVASGDPGAQGTGGNSLYPSMSANGQYVAFQSSANGLVLDDTFLGWDIFVRDCTNHTTTRVSVSSGGAQANGDSKNPAISADGRYVAFESTASNLVSGDTNNMQDIFIHDLQTGQTERVSLATGTAEGHGNCWAPAISRSGFFVAFSSDATDLVTGDTNGKRDVFVRGREIGTTTRISVATDGTEGNNGSDNPSICFDGRYVAFGSYASNLVSGDTNGYEDIFVRDRYDKDYLPIVSK